MRLQGASLALTLATLAGFVTAHPKCITGPARTHASCQRTGKANPLDDCPENTILVSQTDASAAFTSIQDAILSLPNDTSAHTILIAPGKYNEQLNVTRPGPLTLLGVTDRPWKGERYANIDHDDAHANQVTVWWNQANHDNTGKITDNVVTSVLTVGPTLQATLTGYGPSGLPVPEGTPFGCSDFRVYNIDFRNDAYNYANGPALAVGVSRANAGFYSCGLYSYQDTLFVGKLGNTYFYDTVIAGQVDFLYGYGTVWIEKSALSLRNCGGGIVAWKGTNTTFENKYGVYVSHSNIFAANSTVAEEIKGTCALGRPWNPLHRSIFMKSRLDASILPAGYIIWSESDPRNGDDTLMATYSDFGPGYDVEAEAASGVTLVLDKESVMPYDSPSKVFMNEDGVAGDIQWIDQSVLVK